MPKMKFDTQRLKAFLLEKVELVAIGAAGFIALLLLLVGLIAAFGAGSPDQKIRADAKNLKNKIATAQAEEEKLGDEKTSVDWPVIRADAFPSGAWYDAANSGDPKKRNPRIRTPEFVGRENEKPGQVTAYVGGVFEYDVNQRKEGIWALKKDAGDKQPPPVEKVRKERLVVGEVVFPYREEVRDYLKALRVDTEEALLSKGLAPTFAGLNVERLELLPDGKGGWKAAALREDGQPDWQVVYSAHDGKVTMSDAVKQLLQNSVYNKSRLEQTQHAFPPFGFATTPFPKIVRGLYPKLELDGIKVRDVEETAVAETGPPVPMGSGTKLPTGSGSGTPPKGKLPTGKGIPPATGDSAEPPVAPQRFVPLTDYPKPFKERVTGARINPFSPYGVFTDSASKEEDKQANPFYTGGGPPGPGLKGRFGSSSGGPPPKAPPPRKGTEDGVSKTTEPSTDSVPERVLLRFVDAGLEEGKFYGYRVQVRFKNPNFGKTKEVAYPSLAQAKELVSGWDHTQPVAIPNDFYFYVVNQWPTEPKVLNPKVTIDNGSQKVPGSKAVPAGKVPFQIHQLVGEANDAGTMRQVGDWVIAERLFIGRGELIGRSACEVEVPVWLPTAERFILPAKVEKGRRQKNSIPINFGDEKTPVLADFWGGPFEEGNTEVLLLGADGSLQVHSSREDSDNESPAGSERLQRYESWRHRLHTLRDAAQTRPAGAPLPGGKTVLPGGR
jgi:hypothetical protein